MKNKSPAFQFYPGDWLRSTDLRSCSVGARGLWIDMICLMHEGYPYGYLKVGNKVILPSNLSRMVGATLQEVEGWIKELEEANVFSRDKDGCIFSRRMVNDEKIRQSRAIGGKLGGNPHLINTSKVNHKVSNKVNLKANLQPTPSYASSSSVKEESNISSELRSSEILDEINIINLINKNNLEEKEDLDSGNTREKEKIPEISEKNNGINLIETSTTNENHITNTRVAGTSKKTSLPPDFTFSESHQKLANELGLDIQTELAKFKDRNLAHGGLYKNWNAAFSNWLRNAHAFQRQRYGSYPSVKKTGAEIMLDFWKSSPEEKNEIRIVDADVS